MNQPVRLTKSVFVAFVAVAVLAISTSLSFAQDSGRGGDRGGDWGGGRGGDRGGDQGGGNWGGRRGGDGGGGGGFDASGFLRRMDANGNGKLESSEMSGRTRGFIENLGIDTSKDISLEEVIRKAGGESGSQTSEKEPVGSRVVVRRVPGFDLPNDSTGKVEGFGIQPDYTNSDEVEKDYGEDVSRSVNRAFRRYDRNENGVLEPDETADGQLGNPTPQESDLNGDGLLNRYEVAERYKARENASSRNESPAPESRSENGSDQGSRSGRGGDQGQPQPGGDNGESRFSRSGGSDTGGGGDGSTGRGGRSRESTGGEAMAAAPAPPSSSPVAPPSGDRMLRSYAESLLKQYDTDGDGQLSKDEMSKMRRPPANADRDNDGMVTTGELMDALAAGETATASSGGPPSENTGNAGGARGGRGGGFGRGRGDTAEAPPDEGSGRTSSSSSRRFSFNSNDANLDGQIQMHEFETDWTNERLAEFRLLDKNDDGVITAEEYAQRDR